MKFTLTYIEIVVFPRVGPESSALKPHPERTLTRESQAFIHSPSLNVCVLFHRYRILA